MNADPDVMRFFPGILDRSASDAFVEQIEQGFAEHGYGLFAIDFEDEFVGFVGVADLPFSDELEIGWRLARAYWGRGIATEGAVAVLRHTFENLGISSVVSITSVLNRRSQAVMQRIGMTHDPEDDFDHPTIAPGHPLRPHVLYRARAAGWEAPPSLA